MTKIAMLASAAFLAVPAVASAAPVFPTANDDPSGLVMHTDPNTSSPRRGKVPAGAKVEVLCQTAGQSLSDPKYGTSDLWDWVRINGTSGFVTDLYVLTNMDRIPGVPDCKALPAPQPPPPNQPPLPPPPPATAQPSWTPPVYWPMITAAAAREGLDARLLAAQLKIESNFRPTVCSEAGACGIAQFRPGTWRGQWNPYRDQCGAKGYNVPTCAIPAQARFMKNLLAQAQTKDVNAIRNALARRSDVPRDVLARINFNDRYQIALMAYHAGWDLGGYGPRTAKYPVNIVAQAGRS